MANDFPDRTSDDDQLFIHSKREAIILLVAFIVLLLWSVGTSYYLGYSVSPEEINRTVWGMPRWVFWGIAVPWIGANLFTIGFCMCYMADDPLDDVCDEDTP